MPETSRNGALISLAEAIVGHLGTARTQRAPKDDAIIAKHIDAAYYKAVDLLARLREEKTK